ncbi:hypothetical protein DB326_06680 [Lacticaseibacillus casei]|nr:hypothetical protein DB326_06680 [Lacticaseibacillus casei]
MLVFVYLRSTSQGCQDTSDKAEQSEARWGSAVKLALNGRFSRFRPRPSFETAVFAGSKSCPQRSSTIWPEIAEFGTAVTY